MASLKKAYGEPMADQLTRDNIRALRAQAGLTQEALAARAGLSRAAIQNAESGRVLTSYKTLVAIASVLGCQVAADAFEVA